MDHVAYVKDVAKVEKAAAAAVEAFTHSSAVVSADTSVQVIAYVDIAVPKDMIHNLDPFFDIEQQVRDTHPGVLFEFNYRPKW